MVEGGRGRGRKRQEWRDVASGRCEREGEGRWRESVEEEWPTEVGEVERDVVVVVVWIMDRPRWVGSWPWW
jgi:hypothetical protein